MLTLPLNDVDIVSIFIAMSDMHLKYKYHRSLEDMLGCAKEAIEYATDHGLKAFRLKMQAVLRLNASSRLLRKLKMSIKCSM